MIFKKTEFMDWEDYRQRIEGIDAFLWSQAIRRRNLQNMAA